MRKALIVIAALILIGGAAFFLSSRDKEHSDMVVVIEKDAPASKSSDPSSADNTAPTTAPQSAADKTAPTDMKTEEKEKLQAELKVALNELPTIEELRSLPTEELHHTPTIVRDGGALVGKKIVNAEANAVLRPETLNFLLECSEKDDLAPAVRALCWHRLLKKIPDWKVFVPVSGAKVPDDIKALATKLDP